MFKLNVPITKSQRKDSNTIIVEGIASDPTIDRDEERFTPEAIKKMADRINLGLVKIRVEHQDKFYTNVGKWVEARVNDDYKLYVKGEIDTRLSLGNDIAIKLEDGEPLFLSVGGRVVDACYEYAKELGKDIKTYKDVILEEISVLLTPSNYNTSLSIAKSVDWNRLKDPAYMVKSDQNHILSPEAITIFKHFNSMIPLDIDEFEKKTLTTAERNKLPDSAFAYVKNMGDGKKVRKLPIHDASHVKNALAVLRGARGGVKGIPENDMDAVKTKVDQAAKKFKVGQYAEKTEKSEQFVDNYLNEEITDEDLLKEYEGLSTSEQDAATYEIDFVTKYGVAGRSGRKPTGGSKDKPMSGNKLRNALRMRSKLRAKIRSGNSTQADRNKLNTLSTSLGHQGFKSENNVQENLDIEKDKKKMPMMNSKEMKGCSPNMKKWFDDVSGKIADVFKEPVSKDMGMPTMPGAYDAECCCDDDGFDVADFMFMARLSNIMTNVELPSDEDVQAMWDDKEYMDTCMNIGEDGYIILSDRSLMYMHHNLDYTVNEKWLLIQLKKLLDNGQWLSSADYTLALNHMYKHLKELNLVKTAKETQEPVKELEKSSLKFTKEELAFLKASYLFKTANGPAPEQNGKVAEYSTILKAASAFEALLQDQNFISLLNQHNMSDTKTEVKKETPAASEETTTPKAEETTTETTTPVEGTETTTEVAPEAAPAETVEAPAPTETAPVETAPEVTPAPETTTPPAVEEKKAEEAPVEAQKSTKVEVEVKNEEVTKSLALVTKSLKEMQDTNATLQKSLQEKDAKISTFEKSVSDLASVVEKMAEKVTKAEMLEKTVSTLTTTVTKYAQLLEKLAQVSPGRKSFATLAESYTELEKSFAADSEPAKTLEQLVEKHIADGKVFSEAYRLAKDEFAKTHAA